MPAPPVSISIGPPPEAWTTVNDYAGGSNLIYSGMARSTQAVTTFTVASFSKANPGVMNIVGHGLTNGMTVTISGATGDWAGVNGIQVVTVVDANNVSVPVNTTAYTGSFNGSVTTSGPLTTQAVWAIQKSAYNISNQVTATFWAGGTVGSVQIWDNRAALSYS